MRQPKIEKDGKLVPETMIYYTDEDYVKIGWVKHHQFTNESMYAFRPASGDERKDGFREELSRANQQDQLLKFKYEYFPRSRSRKQREQTEPT